MIRDLLKNKKVVLAISIFAFASAVVIILAIFNTLNKPSTEEKSTPETSYDKATEQTITTFSGYKADDVMYVGFNNLLESGLTSNQVYDLKAQLKEYGKESLSKLERISYYHKSYLRESSTTYSMKFALNNDEKDVYAKLITKNVDDNYEIHLYSDEKMTKEVKNYSFCSVLVCPVEADASTPTTIDDSGHHDHLDDE